MASRDAKMIEQGRNLAGEHGGTFFFVVNRPVASAACCDVSKQFFKPRHRSGHMLRRVTPGALHETVPWR
jgi:hypothetical protein